MEWNYNLNEAPIDTPIQLLSRNDSPILPPQEFVGTITYGRKDELTRGKCLVGDPDYFYRSAMVAWKEIETLEQCWLYNGCPCRTGSCYGLPDEGCPVYRWFKQIIEKQLVSRGDGENET